MSSLHYRQNIVASIRIAGHQIGDVVSHGGNRADGSHLTACFGSQVMITMLDLDGALQFADAWLAPEHLWVYEYLFVEAPGKLADYGLTYETPSRVVTIPLEFEFKKVPLP